MAYTIVIIGIFVFSIALNIVLTATLLMLGLRWAKTEDVTFGQSLKATALYTVFCFMISGAFLYFAKIGVETQIESLVELLLLAIAMVLIVQLFFETTVLRTVQALLPTILAPVILIAIMLFVFQPFVGQTFLIPTNSMAPTIVGSHLSGKCPQCQEEAFVSVHPGYQYAKSDSHCVCANFHSGQIDLPRGQIGNGDRIFTARFLAPERWDIATFKFPGNPNETYVKRVVGLPGETIHIADGAVFVDGERQTTPESISGIAYASASSGRRAVNGSEENPAVLGPDEYFVLGDNTEQALDSRHWQQGAPDHNCFAVPESYFNGVVTTIYWPPSRWRSFK